MIAKRFTYRGHKVQVRLEGEEGRHQFTGIIDSVSRCRSLFSAELCADKARKIIDTEEAKKR